MKKILIISAHPDDEALGCGGTIFKHQEQGDSINLLFLTDGISARDTASKSDYSLRQEGISLALDLIRPVNSKFCQFPDNQLDSVPILHVVKEIENFIEITQPDIVYTHYYKDLNVDHCIASKATLTACRPLPGKSIKKIIFFEVISNTEWTFTNDVFKPNLYVDISNTFDKKLNLSRCYNDEMREFPHPRSYENLKSLAKVRGATIGVSYAEAFYIEREIL